MGQVALHTAFSSSEDLTDRQREIFLFIYESSLNRGFQPSIREIGEKFGISSPNGVTAHIRALEKKGWIGGGVQQARCLMFLKNPDGSKFTGFAMKGGEEGGG